MTLHWYANRKVVPTDDFRATEERDHRQEWQGIYRLKVVVSVTRPLTDSQRRS
jgi:hypothetical protein